MPTDPLTDLQTMGQATLWVAVGAMPVALVAAAIARWQKQPFLPRWKPPGLAWNGLVILALFAGYYCGLSITGMAIDASGLYQRIFGADFPHIDPTLKVTSDEQRVQSQQRMLWVSALFLPVYVTAATILQHFLLRPLRRPRAAFVSMAVFVWLGIGSAVVLLHATVQWLFVRAGIDVTPHSLQLVGPTGDGAGGVVFALAACVCGPMIEEYLFRGLLVPWAGGRWYRPWVLAFAAAGVSGLPTLFTKFEPVLFVAILTLILYLANRFGRTVWKKFPRRTFAAVWSTSILFAAAHSAVWPTPIPLFLLSVGLGCLSAHTRTWWPAWIVHGLFNTVSFVFLLLKPS